MREVYAKCENLGLNDGDVVTVHLLNSVGAVSNLIYAIPTEFICENDSLTLTLLENEKIPFESYYKITLPTTLSFTFSVPVLPENTPHELSSFINIGCFNEFFRDGKLVDSFVEKLELFFTGENPHFTNKERRLVAVYVFYADKVIGNNVATVDVAMAVDAFLASMGE